MTIQRADKSVSQSNLFEPASSKDWNKEVSERSVWPQKLKTVEAAKDKAEGMRTRAKGKRGGDGSKNNSSTFGFDAAGEPDASPSTRRAYENRPTDANVLFVGDLQAEEHVRGVRRVDPPQEKKAPKTHKVVNLNARTGALGAAAEEGQNAFTVLAGAGKKPEGDVRGRRCYGNFNAETMPIPQKPQGRGGRKEISKTDPWKYEKEAEAATPELKSIARQRYVATPPHVLHSFEAPPKQPRYPNYRVNPPYSVGA